MVNNIADAIEDYIRKELASKEDGQVELKRTELANIMSCAPSQISYVLSTRFTHDRGFIVESRRGLGGYIRITIINTEDKDDFAYEVTIIESAAVKEESIYEDMINKIKDDSDFEYIKSMIDYLVIHRMVTKREAELCAHFIYNLYNTRTIGVKDRTRLIRSVFITLSRTRSKE